MKLLSDCEMCNLLRIGIGLLLLAGILAIIEGRTGIFNGWDLWMAFASFFAGWGLVIAYLLKRFKDI